MPFCPCRVQDRLKVVAFWLPFVSLWVYFTTCSDLCQLIWQKKKGTLLIKIKKDTLQNTECLIVFNLFPYSYKTRVREQIGSIVNKTLNRMLAFNILQWGYAHFIFEKFAERINRIKVHNFCHTANRKHMIYKIIA